MILEKNQTEQGDLVYQIANIEIGFHELKHRKMKKEKNTCNPFIIRYQKANTPRSHAKHAKPKIFRSQNCWII